MIVYKVVEKQTRWCSNWTIFKHSHVPELGYVPDLSKGRKFKKENPQYFPRYFKGKIIHAAPDSPGILCFETKTTANYFRSHYPALSKHTIIIKVKGIGESQYHFLLARGAGGGNFIYDKKLFSKKFMLPPLGTIAFPSVKVLE